MATLTAQQAPPGPTASDRGWWRAALALVAGVTLVRLAYLAWWCPYELIEDEAHYWEWSRRLGWSYYSKGPGIALAIRAGTEVFGTSEFGVRAPAAIAGGIAALAIGALARQVSGSARVAWYAAACFLLAPLLQGVGLLSTIDGPFVACWAVACWAGWLALQRGGRGAWITLGAALALGFLSKYTIVLLLPGIVGYALARRRHLNLAPTWRAWAAAGAVVMLAGLAPVVVWNAEHQWVTVKHLLGHLGLSWGDMPVSSGGGRKWNPLWPLEFIGTQAGIVGPGLALALIGVVQTVRSRSKRPTVVGAEPARTDASAGRAYLVWCGAPVVLFYLAISLLTEAEGNWAMGGYVTLLALGGWVAAEGVSEYRERRRVWREARASGAEARKPGAWRKALWHYTIGYGLVAALLIARLDWVAHAAPLVGMDRQTALRRLEGARQMAANTRELAAALERQTGLKPFVIAQHYGRASALAFYLRDDDLRVYCSSSRMNGRGTQYDYWSDTSLDDPMLRGRPAVLVGAAEDQWRSAFAQVTPIDPLRGDGKKRPAFLGVGYSGLARPEPHR